MNSRAFSRRWFIAIFVCAGLALIAVCVSLWLNEHQLALPGDSGLSPHERIDRIESFTSGFAVLMLALGVVCALKTLQQMAQTVTERDQQVRSLHESEERFRQLTDAIEDVFWMCSPDMHEILYVSPAYERIWGRSISRLYAHPLDWVDAIVEDDRERVFAAFARMAADGSMKSVEYRIRTPDGEERWLSDRGFAVYDEAGRVYRVAGVARDITKLKTAQQQNEKLANDLSLLLESTDQGIYGIDAKGCCTFINKAGAQMLGYSPNDLLGVNMHEKIHHSRADGSLYPESECCIFRAFRSGCGCRVGDEKFWRNDGTGFPVEYSSHPIINNGEIKGAVVAFNNITERKRLEAQLIEGSKMQTVGQLAGGIAHDFNTILTSIIGHADLIAQASQVESPFSRSASEIGKSAHRAAGLTQQLLAFSRKQMLQPELLDLNSVVSGMDVVLRRLLGDSIEVLTATNARHPWAKADVGQLQQVLVSLALNARDAMPRGGKLTLETADVTLDETYVETRSEVSAGEYVMIAITDTGNGISDDVKPHLFEPFFTTKPQGEGTGLGLAMCYGILKQSRGHISVYSEIGHGTTFKAYLPQVRVPKSEPTPNITPANTASTPRGTETILLVEDDASLRDLAAMVLERLGYTVSAAANGPEALVIATQNGHQIDLLLTDVVMPQMNGKELAERLRIAHPYIEVLFTSAYTEDAIVYHGILDAGIDFLHKPYTPTALAQRVRKALNKHTLEPATP